MSFPNREPPETPGNPRPTKVSKHRSGFKESHLLRFGLEKVSETPLILRCRFCYAFGREKKENAKREPKKQPKLYEGSFRSDHFLQHLQQCHYERWTEYDELDFASKTTFFPHIISGAPNFYHLPRLANNSNNNNRGGAGEDSDADELMDEDAPAGPEPDLIALTKELLDAVADRDYNKYQELTDESLTCFEPEAAGHLVEGLDFHKFYFQMPLSAPASATNTTIVRPHQRMLGPAAGVVSYVRLTQKADRTLKSEETRVWKLVDDKWKTVHFHRSECKA